MSAAEKGKAKSKIKNAHELCVCEKNLARVIKIGRERKMVCLHMYVTSFMI